ncbi:hypothetical protein BX600DRAFT_442846 [Xylariales sp. PMI_506]|nr:hypothetical protein BX600DRAFT_442846 [Xylariales sp. PMI_506]
MKSLTLFALSLVQVATAQSPAWNVGLWSDTNCGGTLTGSYLLAEPTIWDSDGLCQESAPACVSFDGAHWIAGISLTGDSSLYVIAYEDAGCTGAAHIYTRESTSCFNVNTGAAVASLWIETSSC